MIIEKLTIKIALVNWLIILFVLQPHFDHIPQNLFKIITSANSPNQIQEKKSRALQYAIFAPTQFVLSSTYDHKQTVYLKR